MFHIIYMSSEAVSFTREALHELLEGSRKRNGDRGITGALFYSQGNFLQVIEGEKHDVRQLFGTISRDPRHRGVTVLFQEEIPRREFSDWTMAFHGLDEGDAEPREGFNDLFTLQNNPELVDAYAPKVRAFLRPFLR